MDEEDGKARRLAEIEALCIRALGQAMPDRLVTWLGVGRRSAERWLSGALSWPDPVVGKLEAQALLVERYLKDLETLTKSYVDEGLNENLAKLRIRDFASGLSDQTPEKEAPRRKSADD